MILHKENIDYNRHCKHALGNYVQVHHNNINKNTTAARLLDCLYLHPTLIKQEGQELLCLQTICVIMRHKVTPVLVAPPSSARFMHWQSLMAFSQFKNL